MHYTCKGDRMTTLIETTPKMDLAIQDIAHLVEELRAYHAIYSPLFQRREQRAAAYTYLQGLLAPLPRKSIEPMVLAVDDVAPKAVRALQSFISEGQWNDERLLHQHWQEVETDLGAADGVLMVDGSDFPKQGVHSAGVKRQYCGELGKRANCQAGVCIGSASAQGYTVLDRRLYVPTEWLTDAAYADRRRQCGLRPTSPSRPNPRWHRRCSLRWSRARRCGVGGWWRTRRLAATRAFWMAWRDWACGILPKCPTPHGSGKRARPPTSRRGGGGAPARSGSVLWPAPQRRGRCWRLGRRCPLRPGHAKRSRKVVRDPWWQSLPPCGRLLCGTPCQGLMSGWCCVGTSRRGS